MMFVKMKFKKTDALERHIEKQTGRKREITLCQKEGKKKARKIGGV